MVKLNNTAPLPVKDELWKQSNILSITAASHVPATAISSYKETMDEREWTHLNHFIADEDYIYNMNVELFTGKFFQPRRNQLTKATLS